MKSLLKPQILLALLAALATNAASAADAQCMFYPKQMGMIDEYSAPTPVEDANARELIDKLTPSEIFAAQRPPTVQDGVLLTREGKDSWYIRQAHSGRNALFAMVHGPSSIGQKWQQDYHRALTKVLNESLRRGVKLDIVTQGNCQ